MLYFFNMEHGKESQPWFFEETSEEAVVGFFSDHAGTVIVLCGLRKELQGKFISRHVSVAQECLDGSWVC